MLSLLFWPKVITLSGFYCISFHFKLSSYHSEKNIHYTLAKRSSYLICISKLIPKNFAFVDSIQKIVICVKILVILSSCRQKCESQSCNFFYINPLRLKRNSTTLRRDLPYNVDKNVIRKNKDWTQNASIPTMFAEELEIWSTIRDYLTKHATLAEESDDCWIETNCLKEDMLRYKIGIQSHDLYHLLFKFRNLKLICLFLS